MRNNYFHRSLTAIAAGIFSLALLAPISASAQAVRVDGIKVEMIEQKTPIYNVSGVTDKRTDSKTWLEFNVYFETQVKQTKATAIDGLVAKFYLVLDNIASKEEARTLVGETKLLGVPANEKSATVLYLPPAAIEKITGSRSGAKAKFWGVEFLYNGVVVGRDTSSGSLENPWWNSPKAYAAESGILKRKSQTPYAPLWGDFYASESED
ncbi:hypothetical protein OAF27_01730 [Verrucomicrobiales bacterium]|nr:hypothetical protein [Verrucomicrobiales bacterium]